MRTLTIMGRTEDETKIDLAKLLYPPMQAVDIHSLDLDIVHSGMDQRKIHMLVREIFPKMKWKVPVAVHHKLLPGLSKPADTNDFQILGKMSKSDPNSGVFIHNTDDEIKKKIIKGAFRKSETIVMTDLENLPNHSDKLGMISTVIIGNSSTYNYKDLMINPRGYKSKYNLEEQTNPDLKV